MRRGEPEVIGFPRTDKKKNRGRSFCYGKKNMTNRSRRGEPDLTNGEKRMKPLDRGRKKNGSEVLKVKR